MRMTLPMRLMYPLYITVLLATLLPLVNAAKVLPKFTDNYVPGKDYQTAFTDLANSTDLLVIEQTGNVHSFDTVTFTFKKLIRTFNNVDFFSDRGCLGIKPDPDYVNNKFVYAFCTLVIDGSVSSGTWSSQIKIIKFEYDSSKTVQSTQETVIFSSDTLPPYVKWHVGGAMDFYNGKLYIAVGNLEDLPNMVNSHSQRLDSQFGKILRLNIDGSIPSDNPFGSAIWAIGFRNPFTMSIDQSTGTIYVGDVGQGAWEEVNVIVKGGNYGWPYYEGPSNVVGFTSPFYAYKHQGGLCAITGIVFFNGTFPEEYNNKVYFNDFCTNQLMFINGVNVGVNSLVNSDNHGLFATLSDYPIQLLTSSTSETSTSEIYYITRGYPKIGRIKYTPDYNGPRMSLLPNDIKTTVNSNIEFTADAENYTDVFWLDQNGLIKSRTKTLKFENVQMNLDNTVYRALFVNEFASVYTNNVTLIVSNNHPPKAMINYPVQGKTFKTGDTIFYEGVGYDEDYPMGIMDENTFTWSFTIQHDTHWHGYIPQVFNKKNGSFIVPDLESTEPNMWLRIALTVVDSEGIPSSQIRDIYPETPIYDLRSVGNFTVNQTINGDDIKLDDIPYPRGISVYGNTKIVYNLKGLCNGSFVTDIGIDDSSLGSMLFQVYTNDILIVSNLTTREIKASDTGRITLLVNVSGIENLTLVTKGNVIGNWAGARITECDVDLINEIAEINNEIAEINDKVSNVLLIVLLSVGLAVLFSVAIIVFIKCRQRSVIKS